MTEEEKKQRKAAYDREYRKQNAEKRREYARSEAEKARRRDHYRRVLKERNGHGPREIYVGDEAKRARARELYAARYREKKLKKHKAWREANAEKLRAWHRENYAKNKAKILNKNKLRGRVRRATDPVYRVIANMRTAVGRFLTGRVRAGRTMALIGCSREELRAHLESQFKDGMSWENYGRNGWHVDHKHPVSRFDLTNPDQQRACFHWTNLQPLWAIDNIRKGNRV